MIGGMTDPGAGKAEVLAARPRRAVLADGGLRVAAPAKINLDLLVGPRRPDGYHDIDSLVAKITLYDELAARLREDGPVGLHCEGLDCGPIEENLALRAARLLAERAGRRVGGAEIRLAKAIPPGRGLGGGSSDAAAALVALDELWRLGLPAASP